MRNTHITSGTPFNQSRKEKPENIKEMTDITVYK